MAQVSQFAGAAAQNGDASAIRALRADRALQFSFPDSGPAPKPPHWLDQLGRFFDAHAPAFGDLGWGVLVVLVLVAAFFVVRSAMRHRFDEDAVPARRPQPAWQPSAEEARALLHDADALAAAGNFAGAAHILLLIAVEEIRDRRPGLVAPALTSREIARHPDLSAKACAVFSEIAAVVEAAVFGDRPLAAADFARCRTAFEAFTAAASWQEAA